MSKRVNNSHYSFQQFKGYFSINLFMFTTFYCHSGHIYKLDGIGVGREKNTFPFSFDFEWLFKKKRKKNDFQCIC